MEAFEKALAALIAKHRNNTPNMDDLIVVLQTQTQLLSEEFSRERVEAAEAERKAFEAMNS